MNPQPKRKRKKPAYSDGYLMQLWRQAVRVLKGDRCLNCGAPMVETHHLIHRSGGHKLLHYDPRNGIPLCRECHDLAHRSPPLAMEWVSVEDAHYVTDMACYRLVEWLSINHMTRDEWLTQQAETLKGIIKGEV